MRERRHRADVPGGEARGGDGAGADKDVAPGPGGEQHVVRRHRAEDVAALHRHRAVALGASGRCRWRLEPGAVDHVPQVGDGARAPGPRHRQRRRLQQERRLLVVEFPGAAAARVGVVALDHVAGALGLAAQGPLERRPPQNGHLLRSPPPTRSGNTFFTSVDGRIAAAAAAVLRGIGSYLSAKTHRMHSMRDCKSYLSTINKWSEMNLPKIHQQDHETRSKNLRRRPTMEGHRRSRCMHHRHMQPAAMVMGKQVRREERRRRWNFPSVTIMERAPLPQGRRPQPACSRQGPEGTEADEHRLAIFEQIFFLKKKHWSVQ